MGKPFDDNEMVILTGYQMNKIYEIAVALHSSGYEDALKQLSYELVKLEAESTRLKSDGH
tara:strand:+ start:2344 stop:2523 length:180 start_codon:yes stop_codon:yes gene_type:complete